jgi:soluble lytic murein transglycosylase-like protein
LAPRSDTIHADCLGRNPIARCPKRRKKNLRTTQGEDAIARTESGLNPLAVGRNADGLRDIGLTHNDSAWLPTLAAYGISERDLFQPCTSIHVGAWLLAHNYWQPGDTTGLRFLLDRRAAAA